MNEKVSHIGEKLRAARFRQRLSLRELAEKAEVSPSLISKVENGKANPSVRSLHGIAEAFSLPVNYFFPDKRADNRCHAMITQAAGVDAWRNKIMTKCVHV